MLSIVSIILSKSSLSVSLQTGARRPPVNVSLSRTAVAVVFLSLHRQRRNQALQPDTLPVLCPSDQVPSDSEPSHPTTHRPIVKLWHTAADMYVARGSNCQKTFFVKPQKFSNFIITQIQDMQQKRRHVSCINAV